MSSQLGLPHLDIVHHCFETESHHFAFPERLKQHHESAGAMPDRAGYQVSVYAIDVSPSMGEVMEDPAGSSSSGKGAAKTKLDFVKEYVARKLEPKVRLLPRGTSWLEAQ